MKGFRSARSRDARPGRPSRRKPLERIEQTQIGELSEQCRGNRLRPALWYAGCVMRSRLDPLSWHVLAGVLLSIGLVAPLCEAEDARWENELRAAELSEPALVRAMLGALREVAPDATYERTEPLTQERQAEGSEAPGAERIYLDNLFRSLPDAHEERVEAVRRLASVALSSSADLDAT